jgi:hypothetical protein
VHGPVQPLKTSPSVMHCTRIAMSLVCNQLASLDGMKQSVVQVSRQPRSLFHSFIKAYFSRVVY